ncbi:DUF3231 family protein [Metabacillus bambusae]|uniref:DUF3231 family protein n=1 Tax=Metabacillus bambusae TaxID=2795218 RepID=A0ABS3N790_9BACI|nr:DUF3231 family protein [Metabacillus bambusae]MBO1514099.1 DUF3231 family protein [Metabacillus bambusae]
MAEQKKVRLTSGELSQLWIQFMNDSASICLLSYFLNKVEDAEIKPIIEYSLKLSNDHVNKITSIFTEENSAIPHGFKIDEDVELNAPRLFSDSYVLYFIHKMAKIGLTAYSMSLSVAVRSDITSYYKECMTESMDLYEKSKDVLLEKGLYTRSPYISYPKNVGYVKKQGFMLDFIGDKRPLTALEITNLYSNIQRNALGIATLIGFCQVATSKDVTNFITKGIEIAKKHIEECALKLKESNIPAPLTWDSEVTDSTEYTLSEKIIMFYTAALIAMSIGYYGFSVTSSPRVDLERMYNSFISDIQRFAEDGANIMIKNSWLEEPPSSVDRDELARKNYNEK